MQTKSYVKTFLVLIAFATILSACATFTPPRYLSSTENMLALQSLGVGPINVAPFKGPNQFKSLCRMSGNIVPPKKMSFGGYISNALSDELKNAGLYDDQLPVVTLSGIVEMLSFDSDKKSLANPDAEWNIRLKIISSNGKSLTVNECYVFKSVGNDNLGCHIVAESFIPAVQNVIGNLIKSPDFRGLLVR